MKELKDYIKEIKQATTRKQLDIISYSVFGSKLSNTIDNYCICRRIELGLDDRIKKEQLQEAIKFYKIKY